MKRPLAIDLFCGLGGWTDGPLSEGYDVVGFDIERHDYGTGGYPSQLVLQDVLTIHGKQFKDASLIVCSPPCQEFSYMAMPWTRAKQIEKALHGKGDFPKGYKGSRTITELTALFDACFRIQREAIEAAGHFIPLVVENVRGAEKWVGRARWRYGSFYLWGDVPALMPIARKSIKNPACTTWYPPDDPRHKPNQRFNRLDGHKVPGFRFDGSGRSFQTASMEGVKTPGRSLSKGSERKFGTHNMGGAAQIAEELGIRTADHWTNPKENGTKQGGDWWNDPESMTVRTAGGSPARKAASAMIARIPFPLAQWIARAWYPREESKVEAK